MRNCDSLKVEREKVDEPSEVTAGLLSYLLSTDMPMEEIYANISELMLAAVDTVTWLKSICDRCYSHKKFMLFSSHVTYIILL
jgi:thymidine kinase